MQTLDTRGLSCPEPVLLLRRALKTNPDALRVLTDQAAARENVTRAAEHAGYVVVRTDDGGDFILELTRRS